MQHLKSFWESKFQESRSQSFIDFNQVFLTFLARGTLCKGKLQNFTISFENPSNLKNSKFFSGDT